MPIAEANSLACLMAIQTLESRTRQVSDSTVYWLMDLVECQVPPGLQEWFQDSLSCEPILNKDICS